MACSHHGNSRHLLRWGGKHHREKERDSSSILGYFRRQGDTWSEALQAYFAAREEVGEGLFLIVPTSCANFFFLSYSKFGNSTPFFQACLHPHPPSAIWWHMDVTIRAFGSLMLGCLLLLCLLLSLKNMAWKGQQHKVALKGKRWAPAHSSSFWARLLWHPLQGKFSL